MLGGLIVLTANAVRSPTENMLLMGALTVHAAGRNALRLDEALSEFAEPSRPLAPSRDASPESDKDRGADREKGNHRFQSMSTSAASPNVDGSFGQGRSARAGRASARRPGDGGGAPGSESTRMLDCESLGGA